MRLDEFFDGKSGNEPVVRVDGAHIVEYMARGIDLLSEKDVEVDSSTEGAYSSQRHIESI